MLESFESQVKNNHLVTDNMWKTPTWTENNALKRSSFDADVHLAEYTVRAVFQSSPDGTRAVSMSPTELSSLCSTNLSLKLQRFTERKFHYFQINQGNKEKSFHPCPKKQRPSNLSNLKAKAAESHIYFHGFERYNLMSLCGFGWAERLHVNKTVTLWKSGLKKVSCIGFWNYYVSVIITYLSFTFHWTNLTLDCVSHIAGGHTLHPEEPGWCGGLTKRTSHHLGLYAFLCAWLGLNI